MRALYDMLLEVVGHAYLLGWEKLDAGIAQGVTKVKVVPPRYTSGIRDFRGILGFLRDF